MRLSEMTLSILKNFSAINTGLMAKKGNILRTMNGGKSIIAEATIEQEIPSDFCIYELNQLLAILSLHKDAPELLVEGNDVVILGADKKSKIRYRCCKPDAIKTPPDKNPTLPSSSDNISFLLTEQDFKWIMKSSAVLSSPNIAVIGKEGKLYLKALDTSDDAAHTDIVEVDNYDKAPVFFVFKTENWKMLPGTYKVTISPQGIAEFENTSRKITYWIALEAKKP